MDVKKILEQIEAGLEGVTPGPWNTFPVERIAVDEDGNYGVQSRKGPIVADCGHHAGKYAKGNKELVMNKEAVPDYFGSLVIRAREAAEKASRKFPQPNYVTLKIAEEAGEVVRGAVHYAEGRMEWEEVEGEVVQLLAMMIRFVTEGDQINGVIPPAAIRAAKDGR